MTNTGPFSWNGLSKFFTDIWYPFCRRLLRPADVTFSNNCYCTHKFPISAFQNHLQTKSNLHIFIRQSQFIKSISKWDTLYYGYDSTLVYLNPTLDNFLEETYKRFYVRDITQAERKFFTDFLKLNPNVSAEMVYTAFSLSNEYQFY